jgi:hypothetical protein
MRALLVLLLTLGLFTAARAAEVSGRVIKVLPFLLDLHGQIAKSPSLFDRDAYQVYLRQHTNEVSGLRYDVLWSADNIADQKLKVRLELRGVDNANVPKLKTLEAGVATGKSRQWTELPLTGADYRGFGAVTAWRATLWAGDQQLGEQKSFLW